MASFNKFNCFVEDLAEGKHDFSSHTFKIAISNSAPSASNSVLANISQISSGNGYTTGGAAVTVSSSAQTGGVYKCVIDDKVFTASGGSMGPLRYFILYNDTATNDPLIGWYDYGSSITLADTETVTVDFDGTNGAFTLT